MCSGVSPKNFPFQTPMGQTSTNPASVFATSQAGTQFDAGDPNNFPAVSANQPAAPLQPSDQVGNPLQNRMRFPGIGARRRFPRYPGPIVRGPITS